MPQPLARWKSHFAGFHEGQVYRRVGRLVHASAAEVRLCRVDISTVPLRVDKRFHRILGGSASDEFAISAPPPRMASDPDVNGKAPEHAEAALEVGCLIWILRRGQPPQVARAHDVQHAVTVTNVERPRGASARVAAGDVRSERERPEADRVSVLEPMVDPHLWIAQDPNPNEGPQR